MFEKVISFLQRIIYFRRYRSAERIRRAAALLSSGTPVDALFVLRDAKKGLHQSLWPVYALTLGQVFVAMDRLEEAEKQLNIAVSLDDGDIASRARALISQIKRIQRT